MSDINKELAYQLLFTDPITGEELRPKCAPIDKNGALVLLVTNKDGSRNWKHTIYTEEM